ncbi:hypothetical protein BDB00DRAFT_875281 [Zychaea mexicana]|uniref:uncharacterized protein n=1 Tax=Zychaea mexicana TaxID=64656 RepID=UPI0022FEC3A7|nr:uncharacterized protein BDB00DRAFT_875281 [Zychaea mexicana]KAI9490548.1 hypothetical protein BDB00DRAFT_875281 [Zychaea mexicana]
MEQLNAIGSGSIQDSDHGHAFPIVAEQMIEGVDSKDKVDDLLKTQEYMKPDEYNKVSVIRNKHDSDDSTFSTLHEKTSKVKLFRKCSFVGYLPFELVEKIFLQDFTFLEFWSCTQVCRTWRTFLMDHIWERRSAFYLSSSPLKKMYYDAQTRLLEALRGERDHLPFVYTGYYNSPSIEIFPSIESADNGSLIMHSIGIKGSTSEILESLEINMYSLNVVSICSCFSVYRLHDLCDILSRSKVTVLNLTAPFFVPNKCRTLEFKTMHFLKRVQISRLYADNDDTRLHLAKAFIQHSPRLQELYVYPRIFLSPNVIFSQGLNRPPTLSIIDL